MKQQVITHLIALVVGAAISYFILEYGSVEPLPAIDPDTFRIEERIRIEREVVKPLRDSLTSSIKTIEEIKATKQRTRIIYKERQYENLNLSDSASFNLLRERLRTVQLPN
jgi:hypothetical protein